MKRQVVYKKAIQIRLDAALDKRLEKYCTDVGLSKSEAVRRWIMTLPDGGDDDHERKAD